MKSRNAQRILMLVLSFLFWFAQNTYLPYQTTYLTAMGYSLSLVGTVLGCYGVTQMLLRLPVGLVADLKNKHKYMITAGAFLTGLNALLRLLFPNALGFLAANLVAGLACATWISFMVFFSGLFLENEMQKSTGLIIACSNGGGMLAFVIGSLFYARFGMPLMCVLSIISAVAGTFLCFFIKEEGREDNSPKKNPEKKDTALSLFLRCCKKRLFLFSFLALVQQGILNTTTLNLTAQHAKDLGASDAQLGLSAVLYMGAAVLFAFAASGKWMIRIGARFFITVILILLGIYCLLIPQTTALWQIYLLQMCCALSQGILFTFATSEALKDIPQEIRGSAMGLHQAIFAVGITFVPVLAGNLAESVSKEAAYGAMALLCLLALIAVNAFYRKK